ncbi:MAG: DUF1684 domain-containing protein [Chloroflexota bacterium]
MLPNRGSRLESYRQHRDEWFKNDPDSPLEPVDREAFTGLDYFPERKDLQLDLPVDDSGPGVGERVDIPTTAGEVKPFLRAGRITFDVDGSPVTLSVFTDARRGNFFIPFKDGTTGSETYEGGRFLDPKARPNGNLVVDFNYAYNPWCAYGEGWSCPIPPDENVVAIRIPAGERAFRSKA